MNDVARDDEGEPDTTVALLCHRWLRDVQLLHQTSYDVEMLFIAEPTLKLAALFGANACNLGQRRMAQLSIWLACDSHQIG